MKSPCPFSQNFEDENLFRDALSHFSAYVSAHRNSFNVAALYFLYFNSNQRDHRKMMDAKKREEAWKTQAGTWLAISKLDPDDAFFTSAVRNATVEGRRIASPLPYFKAIKKQSELGSDEI